MDPFRLFFIISIVLVVLIFVMVFAGVIETLISNGRQIDAVHFVQAFKLTENFPSVPLLKTYLKDLRRNSQGKIGAAGGAVGVQVLSVTITIINL